MQQNLGRQGELQKPTDNSPDVAQSFPQCRRSSPWPLSAGAPAATRRANASSFISVLLLAMSAAMWTLPRGGEQNRGLGLA